MDLANLHTYTNCEKCGELAEVDTSLVCTSIPARYRYTCPKCGSVGYVTADKLITLGELDEKMDKETTDNKLDKIIDLLTDIKKLLESLKNSL